MSSEDKPQAEPIRHTPHPWALDVPTPEELNGNREIQFIAPTAPHVCADPRCPGDINRRKLEAFEAMVEALTFIESITGEELQYAEVGTGSEVAIRHANRKAVEALQLAHSIKEA